ncbi:septal ring lytic transglycosylase RlpA family protein [Inmirania thermothiophila]|uniref:Endolytic peptidoglycan transglycosylase RlpA n=1 Tax=Inmirania thermothiophila TaxID=1750597 RepID=A0A3N1Y7D4_9GAMM|nr:septal ring lytic transglycosylase RlpA family protein [Inmirania thermothiophila]ROR34685.1 rare lipoprotein A [Inmirania thermothiophila]
MRARLLPALLLLLGGCSALVRHDGPPARAPDLSAVAEAVPRAEPRSPYGNPDSYVVEGRRYHVLASAEGYRERGIASWYGRKFHGRRTASGEPYDMYAMTAAHRTLPLPTYVRVTNLENGRSVVVRVNDRGPFRRNRIIDLSYAAALRLGFADKGTALVEVEALTPGAAPASAAAAPQPPEPVAAAAPAPPPVRLYLQAGAFVSRRNAELLRRRLEVLVREPVEVGRVTGAADALFRVRIGPLAGVEEADALAERLARIGLESVRVVIE